jgi:hypothetical protein
MISVESYERDQHMPRASGGEDIQETNRREELKRTNLAQFEMEERAREAARKVHIERWQMRERERRRQYEHDKEQLDSFLTSRFALERPKLQVRLDLLCAQSPQVQQAYKCSSLDWQQQLTTLRTEWDALHPVTEPPMAALSAQVHFFHLVQFLPSL